MTHRDMNDNRMDDDVIGIDGDGPFDTQAPPALSETSVIAAANRAARTIAPLWPLESFVAVNPFVGISSHPFADADNTVARVWGGRLVMPRTFYADALRNGSMDFAHINRALETLPESLTRSLDAKTTCRLAFADEPTAAPAATIASLLSAAHGEDWQAFVTDRITTWASGYFDEGQASWRSPWRGQSPYVAWRGEAELDRTPEILGLTGFRSIARTLPTDADALLMQLAETVGMHRDVFELYLCRLLATVAGWAGHARYRGWQHELAGRADQRVKEVLAIRAAWELALIEAYAPKHPDLLTRLRQDLTTPIHPDVADAHALNLVLHAAYEIAERERLLERFRNAQTAALPAPDHDEAAVRPDAQAVFCIDVRSERFRRALESVDAGIETLGFAGFFGFAIEVADVDQINGGAQCPVLLQPQFLVREAAASGDEADTARLARRTWLARRLSAAWQQFSGAAVSSFAYVEALGLTYAWRLLADSFGWRRSRRGERLLPAIDGHNDGTGISLAARIETARGALAGMSLSSGFGRLVALIGHGANVTNNPYASRYNCGACGGHTGEANALVAASVLNDTEVRAALVESGIDIPADTLFVAGVHDTTLDTVTLIETPEMSDDQRSAVRGLQQQMTEAGRRARRERMASFGVDAEDADADALRRTLDWAENRPEWGLAGNMAFIAAPRARTRGCDLEGRAFLHSYDWRADDGFGVLELIMTAPMVVASWISLQYYASTVDNDVFGSGDKTLHNVVGGIGVLEGNGGDLRVGLPKQSLHDGERWMHPPMRLNVMIEAPQSAIADVLEKHDHVRELVDNGWVHLFAILDEGRLLRRYRGNYFWTDVHPVPQGTHAFEVEPERRRA